MKLNANSVASPWPQIIQNVIHKGQTQWTVDCT